MARSPSPAALPSYKAPPLDEIAIAVQFEELSAVHAIHYGLFYEAFKDEFPQIEEQAPIPPKFETFPSPALGVQLQLMTHDKPPLPRQWFLSKDKHDLVQFQTDRLIRNWRKIEGVGTYPRFNSILPKFREAYSKCEAVLAANKLGALRPNQSELSYFNNIYVEDGDSYADTLRKYFEPNVRPGGLDAAGIGLKSEFARVTLVSQIMDDTNEPIGRLYVEVLPATGEGRELVRVQMVVRGRPQAPTLDSVGEFLRMGHSLIVSVFDSMASAHAKRVWGKQ